MLEEQGVWAFVSKLDRHLSGDSNGRERPTVACAAAE